jgi:hypothetical protein
MSTRPVVGAVLAAALVVCTACTGSGGSGSASPSSTASDPALDPAKVESTVRDAVLAAHAVHAKGQLNDSGQIIAFDLQLNSDSASGTITQAGVTIPVMLVNNVYYARFTADVLSAGSVPPDSALGKQMLNKWVPSTSRALSPDLVKELKVFLSYQAFVQDTFGRADSTKYVVSGHDTVNGVPVVQYKDGSGSTSDVAVAAPHYVMRTSSPGNPTTDAGSIDFTGWNQPVAITLPDAPDIYRG